MNLNLFGFVATNHQLNKDTIQLNENQPDQFRN